MKSKKIYLHNILFPKNKNYKYPLRRNDLSKKDLDQGIKVLKSTFVSSACGWSDVSVVA